MIVNIQSDHLEVITHYAHGLQSGQIAMNLKKEFRPPFWLESLTAIVEHDDEQINFEKNNNLTDLGLPSDYKLVKSTNKEVLERCKRIMVKSRHRSGWVALLVSMHLEVIYADAIKSDPEFKTYFNELAELRKELRKVYSVNAKDCEKYYEVLRFCDRLSLILSQNEIPAAGRKLEINKSINGDRYFIFKEEDFIKIDPWPFRGSFEITTEVYQLKKIQFKSNNELQDHLLTQLPVLKTWSITN